MTRDRFGALTHLAERWNSPITVVLYTRDDYDEIIKFMSDFMENDYLKKYGTLHLVFNDKNTKYPVNFLRNLAISQTYSDYIINLDVDFIPNESMSKQLKKYRSIIDKGKKILIIPALELRDDFIEKHGGSSSSGSSTIENSFILSKLYPSTKPSIVELMESGHAYQVHYYKGIHSHFPTDYQRWMKTHDIPYLVHYDYTFEPYFMIKKENCPLFDERFLGYGNDKTSHTLELVANNFTMYVSPNSFIIHENHPDGNWKVDQGSTESWKRWWEFTRDLAWKYDGFKYEVPNWLKEDCIRGDCPTFWEW
eukprot:gene2309-2848_t